MTPIIDFIINFSKNNKIADKEFIETIYNFLRTYQSLEQYVKELLVYDNIYNRYLAFYLPCDKRLGVNKEKILKVVNELLNEMNIVPENKSLAINLCVFQYILHEFKHIWQEREQYENRYSIESRLLHLSDRCEQELRQDRILFQHYNIDPIERQAELSSLIQSIDLAKKLKIEPLVKKFTDNYFYIASYGYPTEYSPYDMYPYPAKWFLDIPYSLRWSTAPLIEELNEYPINDDNLQLRLELGLRIAENEYGFLERKLLQ